MLTTRILHRVQQGFEGCRVLARLGACRLAENRSVVAAMGYRYN
jgi:hypothetical protein